MKTLKLSLVALLALLVTTCGVMAPAYANPAPQRPAPRSAPRPAPKAQPWLKHIKALNPYQRIDPNHPDTRSIA